MKLKARAYLAAEEWRKKYDLVFNFHDGLAEVYLNRRLGYVDTTGNEYWNMTKDQALRQMKNR